MREAFPRVGGATQAEMVHIAKRLGALPPDKRKAFQTALSEKGIDVWELPIVPHARQSEYLPLSFAQQRLWFLEQFEQDNPLYNLFFGIRFLGQLDITLLERSINELIRRHEILRTNIVTVDGEGYQIVQGFRPIALSVIDIQKMNSVIEDLLNTMARDKALAPFNLAHDPLFRVEIIRCSDTDHVLMLTIHHLAFDAWSEELITSELASLYAAFASGTPPVLPELPIQYADFAMWQREWMTSEDFEIQRTYWEQQLRDAPALLTLPLDHPRAAKQTFRGSTETLLLSEPLTQRIHLLCRQHQVTPYMLMLAAFGVVLARYSGQDDVCIGTSIANRSRPETEQLVGFLVNTLVLRIRLEENPRFEELLRRVSDVASSAYAHQDMPFEKLVELLGVQRNLPYTPLFQVLFVMVNMPDTEDFNLPGVRLEPFDFDMKLARFDLTLRISEPNGKQAFQCDLEYNTDLFLQSTIVRMLHHYRTMLESVVTRPEARLSELSMLSDAQRRQLLIEWNEPRRDDFQERCIHELFEAHVRQDHDADAVMYEGRRLSYQELDTKANRLARYLQSLGVRPEVKVGLCLERSLDLIVGMFAVLKAGGVYIPLDPKFPADRLGYMLSDSGTRIVLTQTQWSDLLPETEVEQVCLDRDWPMIAAHPEDVPVSVVRPGNLAYIIYTSGSTGRPKGVAIEHRQLTNYVSGLLERLTLDRDSSFATISTVAADLGNTAIFGALCSGRSLHVLSVDRGFDPNAVAEYMEEHRIDVLKIVPSHLAGLLEASRPERVLPRRCLILGGEAVHQSLVERVRALAPDCEIINHYGPTETTVGVLTHRIGREIDGHSTIPIGRPLLNSKAYILDKDCQPVPAGVFGELYVGGNGLARGYLDRPNLTAERFVPDPFCVQPGGRLYRTGDRVRHRPDGSIEFHGRVDNQVKVRGFRIELGEIEACLRSQTGITDAAAVVRNGPDGTQRLVAYVMAAAQPDLAALREQLAKQLPDYMLPSAIVTLKTMPLTANGKVDRTALPDSGSPNDAGMNQYVAPRIPIEETLAKIWAEILHVERVGIHDNFFALGGDSIKSLQVLARASRQGIRFTPKELFDHQTIAALVALWGDRLTQLEAPRPPQPVVPREPFVLANLHQDQLAAVLEKYGANVVDLYPASPVQHGMVFHSLHSPESNPYFNQIVCTFTHELHLDAFKDAWQRVIERHAILRTGFLWEGVTDCLQIVHGTVTMPIEVCDWRDRSHQEQQAALQEYLLQDRALSFRFDQPPLMRVALMRLTDQTFWMVWSHHHALLDGWCQAVLVREILAFYQTAHQGQSRMPDLAVPYRDYIAWLQQQDAAAAETFWRTYLKGVTAPTQLPNCTQSQPAGSSYGEHHVELSSDVTRALTNLAQAERVTLNTIVQAAWGMVLAHFGGTDEVVFGITVAGRPHDLVGVESIMGVFINTLPLRVRLSPETKLTNWLREIQSSNIELRQYEHTPLVQVQSWSGMDRRTPLFETIVVFQNYPLDDAVEDYQQSLGVDVIRAEGSTNYAITIDAIPGTQLRLTFSYDKQRIDDSTMHLMADHVVLLMEGMAAYPEARLADLPILTPAERTQLLIEWNATETKPFDDRCVSEIFEAQVERTPDVIAVGYRNQRVSYRALNHRANRIAHVLVEAGVGPETLVALLGERDSDLLTMILGIFKAGGAYLPLDPHHPVPRLSQILGLSRTPIVLTTTAYMERLQQSIEPLDAERRPRLILLERILEEEGPGHNLHAVGRPDQLAYVIYTSGSTGVPKGAMITQRGLLNNIRSKLAGLGLSNADVIAQTASQCFDISVWQLLTALLCGGRTQIVPDEIAHDPSRLLTHLDEAGITILEVVPAVLQGLVDAATAAGQTTPNLSKLRWLLPTGETLSPGLCRRWFARYPGVPLMNAYGPAECSDDVAVHPILAPPAEGATHIPIGRPIANLRLYLLNAVLAPVPVGVSGELYVGGIGVGRGYLQDSAKTAGAFLPDPFGKEPGARLYRTGDLGRYRPDGTIEFLGRVDHQVKLRGFRIELGEIETRLLEHPQIQEATVLLREGCPGEQRLVAYVAGLAEAEWDPESLRRFLRAHLPDYMVPTVFVRLQALPRTPNGKIDRRALPIPELNDRDAHDVLLRTPTEEILAGIWADVLNVERVGVHDNFFELGGHSLLATQVISRIRTAFQADLPLRHLFDFPTVKSLAEAVDKACQEGAGRQVPPLVSVPRDGGLALSFAQQRLWFLAQLEPDSPIYNVPIALRLTGPLDIHVLQKSFQEVVRRHEVLRTTFVMVKDQPRQAIAHEPVLSVPVLDLTGLPHDEREARIQHLANEEARRPFDLSTGPLLRVRLLRSGDQEHILLVTLHHIASDGWSMNVLIQEMTTLYAAFANGQPSPLSPLPIQYADYAVWQRQWLQGDVLEEQLSYWKRQLKDVPVIALPTDRPRPAVQTYSGATHAVALSSVLTEQLNTLSRRHGVTLFMTLLAALKVLLKYETDQHDVVVGTDVAHRHRVEVENLVGFFVNQLVLRTNVGDALTFGELLDRVRGVTLAAHVHQDVPFEMLVATLQSKRDLRYPPLFQIKLILQHMSQQPFELPGLTLSAIDVEKATAELDVLVNLEETSEGLSGDFEYNTDLFDASSIARLVGHFTTILEQVSIRSDVTLKELEHVLAEADSQQQSRKQQELTQASYTKLKSIKRKIVVHRQEK